MKPKTAFMFLMVLLVVASSSVWASDQNRAGRVYSGAGYRDDKEGMTFIHLKGTHREIGRQHYSLMSREALMLRDVFMPKPELNSLKDRVTHGFREFYLRTRILPGLRRHIPPKYNRRDAGLRRSRV